MNCWEKIHFLGVADHFPATRPVPAEAPIKPVQARNLTYLNSLFAMVRRDGDVIQNPEAKNEAGID